MRIHVAVATTGRPVIVRQTIERLRKQTRPADGIIVVGAVSDDVALVGLDDATVETIVVTDGRGACKQRNAALRHLDGRCDAVVFFDDDFLPADDYLEAVEKLFADNPDVVGMTGSLLADGAQTGSISFEDAAERLDRGNEAPKAMHLPCTSLYGCNMSFRASAIDGLRFDEMLPLYGWQEDVDFSSRAGRGGRLLKTSLLTGIHLGTKGGRTSGKRLGYSQVANVIYLYRKGTIELRHGGTLMLRNIAANLAKSIWPEPNIDRRGRLWGNIQAFKDLVMGRMDPRRVESL